MKILLILALGSWLVLGALFLGYPTVQRLKDEDHDFGWVMKGPIYFALLLGVLADTTFNAIWGSVIFREFPKEFLFTTRLKRHWYGRDEKQKKRAEPWVRRVNTIDPGHV